MRTMSAKDAKNHFGELLLEAQKAPVTIEKNGRPVAVLLSIEEHEAAEKMKLERLRSMIAEADDAIARGEEFDWTDDVVGADSLEGEAILAAARSTCD